MKRLKEHDMRILVIGCTHAGTNAVQQILLAHPDTEVTVIERHDDISFLSCGISLYLEGTVKRLEDMFYSSPAELRRMGATVLTRHEVQHVDVQNHSAHIVDLDADEELDFKYDKLIITTGSTIKRPTLVGANNPKVMPCKSYVHAQRLAQATQDGKAHDIAVIGAGYVGTELAESFVRTGHHVTLIESNPQILQNYLDVDNSTKAATLMRDHDIDVRLNDTVKGFSDGDADKLIVQTQTDTISVDLAVLAIGFTPVTTLLQGQVELDKHGAIMVNDYQQSSDPDVYAAGDCAITRSNPTGKTAYVPLASAAVRQGRLAGINVFGNTVPNHGTQGTSAMRLFGTCFATTGLTLQNAFHQGLTDCRSITWRGTWRPGYMPSTDRLTITLVYDRPSRRILGAQLISKHEVAQSANALSIAIQNNNTIDDLANIDMLFQPNYDDPFNYLNLAAQQAVLQEAHDGYRRAIFNAQGSAARTIPNA